MSRKRRRFTAAFRAAVALEALRGDRTIQQIAQDNGVHPHQVTAWKKQAQEGLVGVMEDGRLRRGEANEALTERLYEQIGRQKVEIEWLKTKFGIAD
jgi:transposase